MIKRLANFLKSPLKPGGLRTDSGQVAIILILVIAFTLIFYAVTLNLARIGQTKIHVQNAAHGGAALMASYHSSFGQSLFKQELGGRYKYCEKTGLWKSIIFSALLGIPPIFTIAMSELLLAVGAPTWVIVTVAILTLNIGVLQGAYVEPKITSQWHRQMRKLLGPTDEIVEAGIQHMLASAHSDQVLVVDVLDQDGDGLFGENTVTKEPKDVVARFSVYNSERFKTIEFDPVPFIDEFMDALKEFAYEGDDNWGLFDPIRCGANFTNPACTDGFFNATPSEYNLCCVPAQIHAPGGRLPGDPLYDPAMDETFPRDACCDLCVDPNDPTVDGPCFTGSFIDPSPRACGFSHTCNAASPFGTGGGGAEPNPYSWVFDADKEDYYNDFVSFREMLGEDDRHPYYKKDPLAPDYGPNGLQAPLSRAAVDAMGPEKWLLEDTTGYYTEPVFTIDPGNLGPNFIPDWRNDTTPRWVKIYDDCLTGPPPGAIIIPAPPAGDCQLGGVDLWVEISSKNGNCLIGDEWWQQHQCQLVEDWGIFPFLYKVHDWGTTLGDIKPGTLATQKEILRCFWYDETNQDAVPPVDRDCSSVALADLPMELRQFKINNFPLPFNPESEQLFNKTYWVDEDNISVLGTDILLKVDKVTDPNTIPAAFMESQDYAGECTETSMQSLESQSYPNDMPPPLDGFWKRGVERFCTPGDTPLPPYQPVDDLWTYFDRCPRDGYDPAGNGGQGMYCCEDVDPVGGTVGTSCACGESGCGDPLVGRPADFNEDILDNLIYGLPDFVRYAASLLDNYNAAASKVTFSAEFPTWYDELAPWIEPYCDTPPCADCFKCGTDDDPPQAVDGSLWTWLKEIREVKERLLAWRNFDLNRNGIQEAGEGFRATASDPDACKVGWCVPHDEPLSAPGCPIEDLACAGGGECPEISRQEEATFDINGNGFVGDLEDVVACLNINAEGYDASAGWLMRQCLNTCDDEFCKRMPVNHMGDPSTPYTWQFAPATFQASTDCPGGVMDPAWAADITNNLVAADAPNLIGENKGNDWLFQRCRNTCSVAACANLPRTLIPNIPPLGNFDPKAFVPHDIRDDADAAKIINCYDNCSNAVCQQMPLLQESSKNPGPPIPYPWPGGVDPQFEDFTPICPDIQDYTTVWGRAMQDALERINPQCQIRGDISSAANWNSAPASPDYVSWLSKVEAAAIEAANQVAKFKQRRDFLNGRLTEVDHAISFMSNAESKFAAFLTGPDGPAYKLIQERKNYVPNEQAALPYQAIYGWQDEPKKGELPGTGKWHIVKVDARSPRRCDNACSLSQDVNPGAEPRWPSIKTWTKRWGLYRCFQLINHDGVVKARVARYDEGRPNRVMQFPNGVPIWDIRFGHPDRPATAAVDPRNLGELCEAAMIPDPRSPFSAPRTGVYGGAFMLNERTAENAQCWDTVSALLAQGIVAESCAQYFFYNGTNTGMNVRFIKCKDF